MIWIQNRIQWLVLRLHQLQSDCVRRFIYTIKNNKRNYWYWRLWKKCIPMSPPKLVVKTWRMHNAIGSVLSSWTCSVNMVKNNLMSVKITIQVVFMTYFVLFISFHCKIKLHWLMWRVFGEEQKWWSDFLLTAGKSNNK